MQTFLEKHVLSFMIENEFICSFSFLSIFRVALSYKIHFSGFINVSLHRTSKDINVMLLCILTASHSWQAQMFVANLIPEPDPQTPILA